MSRWAVALRAVLGVVVVAGMLLVGAGPAAAHNVLVSSTPAEGQQLTLPPERIELRFNLPVQAGLTALAVTGPGGTSWETGPPEVAGEVVSAPLRPLGPVGQYVIAYRVVSADGHPVSGQITFTLTQPGPAQADAPRSSAAPPAPAASASPSATSEQGDGGGFPAWPWIVGAVVLLIAGGVVALRAGRSR